MSKVKHIELKIIVAYSKCKYIGQIDEQIKSLFEPLRHVHLRCYFYPMKDDSIDKPIAFGELDDADSLFHSDDKDNGIHCFYSHHGGAPNHMEYARHCDGCVQTMDMIKKIESILTFYSHKEG